MRVFLLFIGLLSFQGFSISAKSFLSKMTANYSKLNSLEINLDYRLYKGFDGTEVIEHYQSRYCRSIEGNTYRKIDNVELISTKNYSLKLDHEEKEAVLSKPTALSLIDVDIKETLKRCADVRIKEVDKGFIVQLIIQAKQDIPYAFIALETDGDYWIDKVTFYYSTQANFSGNYFDQDIDYPRLEVQYGKVKKDWADEENLLSIANYLDVSQPEAKMQGIYRDYTLFDLR